MGEQEIFNNIQEWIVSTYGAGVASITGLLWFFKGTIKTICYDIINFFIKQDGKSIKQEISLQNHHFFTNAEMAILQLSRTKLRNSFGDSKMDDCFIHFITKDITILKDLMKAFVDKNGFNALNQSELSRRLADLVIEWERLLLEDCIAHFGYCGFDVDYSRELYSAFKTFQKVSNYCTDDEIKSIILSDTYIDNKDRLKNILSHYSHRVNRQAKAMGENIPLIITLPIKK